MARAVSTSLKQPTTPPKCVQNSNFILMVRQELMLNPLTWALQDLHVWEWVFKKRFCSLQQKTTLTDI